MRLLVTGGAGFIGSNFIRHVLKKDPDVHITNFDKLTYAGNLDNLADIEEDPRYEFVRGDVRNYEQLRAHAKGIDAIVHFAAESHVDNSLKEPGVFFDTNVVGTQTLLRAAKDVKVPRIVHVSTDEVYGSRLEGKFSEKDPLKPTSPYSKSKAESDSIAQESGLPVIITRSSNNFGPYQHPEKLIPRFVTNLIEGEKVPLYGNGKNVRDWIYVEDNCAAINTVLKKGKVGEIYNIGGDNLVSNLDITHTLLELLKKDRSWINYVADRQNHDRRYAIKSDKIRELGWKPEQPFDIMLMRTVQWYISRRDWWLPLRERMSA